MDYWDKLSDLLEQETELWQKIYQHNQKQMEHLDKGNFLQEGEKGIEQKELWLNQIFQLHKELDNTQLAIEREEESLTFPLQKEIQQKMEKLMCLQQELQEQEQRAGRMLTECSRQTREEIRIYRNKKQVNFGYQAVALPGESALLDQKK